MLHTVDERYRDLVPVLGKFALRAGDVPLFPGHPKVCGNARDHVPRRVTEVAARPGEERDHRRVGGHWLPSRGSSSSSPEGRCVPAGGLSCHGGAPGGEPEGGGPPVDAAGRFEPAGESSGYELPPGYADLARDLLYRIPDNPPGYVSPDDPPGYEPPDGPPWDEPPGDPPWYEPPDGPRWDEPPEDPRWDEPPEDPPWDEPPADPPWDEPPADGPRWDEPPADGPRWYEPPGAPCWYEPRDGPPWCEPPDSTPRYELPDAPPG